MKTVRNLIIVDESGSMETIRKEAFTGINETIQTVKMMQEKYPDMLQTITLLTFDSNNMKLHYDDVPAGKVKLLDWKDYQPCAGTPLYDAIGKGVTSVFTKSDVDDKVLVTIITDGYENSSCEYDYGMISKLIAKMKKQGWMFAFIGTDDIAVEEISKGLNIDSFHKFERSAEGTRNMWDKEMKSRMRFNEYAIKDMPMASKAYFDED